MSTLDAPTREIPVATETAVGIPLSAPVNLRDLGGIPVRGGVIRTGFAIRADDLSTVTEEAAADLVAGGLSAVIDLRSPAEVTLTGRGPFSAHGTVSYHHVPFLTSIGEAAQSGDPFDQSTFGRLYQRMYRRAAPQIVSALAIIAHSRGTVAFHCAAGQDRTGVLAASLLLALGADPQVIVADYVRTGENSDAIHRRILPVIGELMRGQGFGLDPAARSAVRKEFSPAPMLELLESLSADGEDPLDPLREAGLSDGLMDRLSERALERP